MYCFTRQRRRPSCLRTSWPGSWRMRVASPMASRMGIPGMLAPSLHPPAAARCTPLLTAGCINPHLLLLFWAPGMLYAVICPCMRPCGNISLAQRCPRHAAADTQFVGTASSRAYCQQAVHVRLDRVCLVDRHTRANDVCAATLHAYLVFCCCCCCCMLCSCLVPVLRSTVAACSSLRWCP